MRTLLGEIPPRALILVRNTVTHDARVLREASTLRGLGYVVDIAGVVSTVEHERRLRLEGFDVVRLVPRASSRRSRHSREAAKGSAMPSGVTNVGARQRLRGRLGRLAVTATYYFQGVRLVLRARPALVHANDYNTMWIAVAAKLLRGSGIVYDCHELWPDRNGRPEWRPWLLACEWLFVRAADATITTSPGYAAAIAGRYRVPAPRVVRNIPAQRAVQRNPAAGEGRRAVYVGGLMPGRGLESAIRALADAPGVQLQLIGPGRDPYRDLLYERAIEAGVADRLMICPAVPPTAVIDSISDADVGLMLIEPVCRSYELTLPNKLFEYAAAGLPILASDMPVIAAVVRDEGLGEVVPPDDIQLIAEALLRLVEPAHNAEARERVRRFAARVTWDSERQTLERVYQQVSNA